MDEVTLAPTAEVVAFYAQRCLELEAANVGLATEAERLKSGLRFYAHREHIAGFESWSEGDDPESPDWLCDDHPSGNMIETGGVARTILAGHVPNWEGSEPMEHSCEPGMQALAADLRRLEADKAALRESKERIHRRAQEAEAERDRLRARVAELESSIDCACNALTDSINCSGNDPATNRHWVRRLRAALAGQGEQRG